MDRLRTIAEAQRVFVTADAKALGHDDKSIARALKHKLWVRVRHGAYTFSDLWEQADVEERHRIRAAAVMRSLGDRVALSHVSAAIEHGLRVWNADLSHVHVTRLDGGAGRTERDVVHHEGLCLGDDVMCLGEHLVMRPERAALETASQQDVEGGMVVLDSALNLRRCEDDDLERVYRVMQHWPKSQHLQVALPLADAGADSVGESRARYLCWAHNLPRPETQFEVVDRDNRLVATTDFGWPEHRLVGEFDGKAKYGRLLKPGEEPSDAVFREKRREDRIREVLVNWAVIRVIWADLYRGAHTAARIRRLLNRAA
ncbi:MAG: type IV toxin-antitoxin system AbiEi family antitoxin domain-containing protein [Nocardioidaceae bacterium]